MRRLFSIGYASHTLDSFLAVLSDAGITVVADVRANPVSRKKGFSKRQLAAALAEVNISYQSCTGLGIPAAARKQAGSAAAWSDLISEYARSLEPGNSRSAGAEKLAESCLVQETAVMCMESDLDHCHRKPLTEWIAANKGLELVHL